jgi:UDP-N-acetyl-D-glucosamine dehydrogenase
LVIGVSYKPNVADIRETPVEALISGLKKSGAVVSWHDDLVKNWNGESSSHLSGADIAIVLTKHESINPEAIKSSAPYVFDTTGKINGVATF